MKTLIAAMILAPMFAVAGFLLGATIALAVISHR